MLHVQYLEQFDLPELEPYRTLRRRKDMERLDRFVVEGDKCVRRLLDARTPYVLESLLLTPEWLLELRRELDARPEEIRAYVTDRKAIEMITGFTVYQGIKATARIVEHRTLESLIQTAPRPWLWIACDSLTNAENMGAIIRNAAAFGIQALLVGETSTSPFLTRTIRASMGTIFDLPWVDSDDLANTLRDLKQHGMRIVAAHAHTDQKTIATVDFTGDVCIVFGSEGHGLAKRVAAVCDELVIIPMAAQVDSLNVGSAVAVFLYEAARQRGRM